MIVPAGLPTFREALRARCRDLPRAQEILGQAGLATSVGDEGGFAPRLKSTRKPSRW